MQDNKALSAANCPNHSTIEEIDHLLLSFASESFSPLFPLSFYSSHSFGEKRETKEIIRGRKRKNKIERERGNLDVR